MSDELDVLEASVARLRALVESFSPEGLRAQAYPSEWTVADVLSHLGSGAEIMIAGIDHALGGPDSSPQPIWDRWNAKDPDAKAADALIADRALVERLAAMTAEERAGFALSRGPMHFDFVQFVRMRLNEHALHLWDIVVVNDPGATVATDAVPFVLELLPMLAGFAGKPTGATRELRVRTTTPDRQYVIDIDVDRVSLTAVESESEGAADLEISSEGFVRLVYGRLDPDHTPAFTGAAADLDELRRVFPGL